MRILGMLPSEIERLNKAEPSPELAAELLEAIGRVLATPSSNDESIFLAASNLSRIGLERFVSPVELASVIIDLSFPSVKDFMSGLDRDYAGEVALAVLQNIMDGGPSVLVADPGQHRLHEWPSLNLGKLAPEGHSFFPMRYYTQTGLAPKLINLPKLYAGGQGLGNEEHPREVRRPSIRTTLTK